MEKSIEKIYERPIFPGMVGDGFRVYNIIPGTGISLHRISPFLLLDFGAEFDFGPFGHVRGVDVHPHKGFETVTIAYKGSLAHHDSKGNSGVINEGDVQWMTAGAGILHKEYLEKEFSKKGGSAEFLPQSPHHKRRIVKDLEKHVVADCWHWTPEEKPEELNRLAIS